MIEEKPSRWKLFIAEMSGTGLLMLIGLSSVILMFAESSPFVALIPSLTLRRVINGFFFDFDSDPDGRFRRVQRPQPVHP